jgi:hypothetical protein
MGYAARSVEREKYMQYTTPIRKRGGKGPLVSHRPKWADSFEVNAEDIGSETWHWVQLAQGSI